MPSETNPVIVPVNCGQVIVSLTCWLRKANLFSDREFIRKYLLRIMQKISPEKETIFNPLRFTLVKITRRIEGSSATITRLVEVSSATMTR
jgi:hypothetical protein